MAVLDITAVRDWFNGRFKLATADTVASVLTLTFDASFVGQTWTVTDGDEETYTGTVDATLTTEVKLKQLLTTYTVTCGTITKRVDIGYYYLPLAVRIVPVVYLEYIQSSGTQYINTGIRPNLAYKAEVKAALKATSSNQIGLIGCYTGSSSPYFSFYIWFASGASGVAQTYRSPSSTQNEELRSSALSQTNALNTFHVFVLGDNAFTIDGNQVGNAYSAVSDYTAINLPMILFGRYSNGTINNMGSWQIEYAKIWDETGTLIMHLCAAFDDNNVACMYDEVSGNYFYNDGSGTFTAGPEKN